MTEATETLGDSGAPLASFIVALIAVAGFCCAVVGLVLDQTMLTVIGLVVGGCGFIAVNGLTNTAYGWRRHTDECC